MENAKATFNSFCLSMIFSSHILRVMCSCKPLSTAVVSTRKVGVAGTLTVRVSAGESVSVRAGLGLWLVSGSGLGSRSGSEGIRARVKRDVLLQSVKHSRCIHPKGQCQG